MEWVALVGVVVGSGGLAALVVGSARELSLFTRANRRAVAYGKALAETEPGSTTGRELRRALEFSQLELAAVTLVRMSTRTLLWMLLSVVTVAAVVTAVLYMPWNGMPLHTQLTSWGLALVSISGVVTLAGAIVASVTLTLGTDRAIFVHDRLSTEWFDTEDGPNVASGQKETPPPA